MSSPEQDHPPASLRSIEHFRAKTRHARIHPTEKLLLWVIAVHLVLMPWALGGMRLWAQQLGLGLAAIGFIVALIPRRYREEHTGAGNFRLIMWPKLVSFPLFWLGLALFGLITVQAMNPAWTYVTDGRGWWMQRIPHIRWLPTGVQVPFERWGPWRMLLIYASIWLTVCTLWVGVTRRRSLQALFFAIAANGLALAGLGIAQRLLGNGKLFWIWESPVGTFFASFVYKNHAGIYLNLALAASCGLAGWYYLRALRRLDKSNPSGVFAFISTCIAVSVVTSYARGATLMMLVFLCLAVGALVIHQIISPPEFRKPVVIILLVIIFGFFLKTGLGALRTGQAWERIKDGVTREDFALEFRELATTAALEMLQDHWVKGTGAGGFRFLFPTYQHRHPRLVANGRQRMYWEQAHNDIVQYPIEFGLAGMILVTVAAGYGLVLLLRAYFWENPLSASVVLGLALTLVYSWWDFPLQNPAILLTCCVVGLAAAMWARFEESNAR